MQGNIDFTRAGGTARAGITLFGHQGPGVGLATEAIEAAGYRIRHQLDYSVTSELTLGEIGTDLMFAEIPHDPDVDVVPVLVRAARESTFSGIPLIVSTPLARLDEVEAAASGRFSNILCDPDISDCVAALSLGLACENDRLSDISADIDSQRLRRLADEVSRIARTLSSLSGGTRPDGGYAASAVSDIQLGFTAEPVMIEPASAYPASEEIRRILRLRRLRDQFFDPSLFADPAWDMLLDLMAARLERAQVAVSSLCIAAAVPPTTALRWIKAMTDHGLLERCADPEDGRRIFIRLSDSAMQAMGRYFEAMKKIGGIAI